MFSRTPAEFARQLEPLPYESWAETKITLHLWSQIVGKIRLRSTNHINQWWNATLRFTPRGFAALGMHNNGRDFELEFDLIDHKLFGRTHTGQKASFQLEDGLSVAAFYAQTLELLGKLGLNVKIKAEPYGVPITTPFAEDTEHHHYDADAVSKWWNIARWTVRVLEAHATDFAGKQSPIHLFWHSFDIAMARFSGRTAPLREGATRVEKEAYFYEVIAAGFWPGDERVAAPTFYTYTAPEPANLTEFPLQPAAAHWIASGSGHLGVVGYEDLRRLPDPSAALGDFFRSGYDAGSTAANWQVQALASKFTALSQPAEPAS